MEFPNNSIHDKKFEENRLDAFAFSNKVLKTSNKINLF